VTPQELDDELGRLASSRGARVLGWSAVGGWCVFLLVHLLPQVWA
jgi:hypothetical protein